MMSAQKVKLGTVGFVVLYTFIAGACSDSSLSGNTGRTPSSKNSKVDKEGQGDDAKPHAVNETDSKTADVDEDEGNNDCPESTALTDPAPVDCKISANGKQAVHGVYAVVLTDPAPCDFRLPAVTISGSGMSMPGFGPGSAFPGVSGGGSLKISIGTYWNALGASGSFGTGFSGGRGGVAHDFPLVDKPAGAPLIDNGFILVQPNHKSYLLVDGGMARTAADSQKTAAIASQISQTQGFGDTTLMQPAAGSESDDFASATVFKAGSVIALYDDTPDMNGSIDVEALVAAAKPTTKKSCSGK